MKVSYLCMTGYDGPAPGIEVWPASPEYCDAGVAQGSYARYLGMEPDATFARFCREANFEVAHGMSAAASSASVAAVRARQNAARRQVVDHATHA